MPNALLPLLAEAGWLDNLTRDFTATQRFVLCLTVVGSAALLTLILAIVAISSWEKVHRREAEMELTRDLLDQGKTAEEIERLIRPADGFSRALERWTVRGQRRR